MKIWPEFSVVKVSDCEAGSFVYVGVEGVTSPFLILSRKDGDAVQAYGLSESESHNGLVGLEWLASDDRCAIAKGRTELRFDPRDLVPIVGSSPKAGSLVHCASRIGLLDFSSMGGVKYAYSIETGEQFEPTRKCFIVHRYSIVLRDEYGDALELLAVDNS